MNKFHHSVYRKAHRSFRINAPLHRNGCTVYFRMSAPFGRNLQSVGASGSWCFWIDLYSQLSGQFHQICQGGSHLVSGIPGSALWHQIKRWFFDSQLSDGEKGQLSVPVLRAFDDSGIFVYGKRIQNTS